MVAKLNKARDRGNIMYKHTEYMIQFNKGMGWFPSKVKTFFTQSLAEKAMKGKIKKNPNADYRLVECEVIKEVKSKLTDTEKANFELRQIGGRIFNRIADQNKPD